MPAVPGVGGSGWTRWRDGRRALPPQCGAAHRHHRRRQRGVHLCVHRLVDKLGRRFLFLEGGLQMLTGLVATGSILAVEFKTYSTADLPSGVAVGLLVSWGGRRGGRGRGAGMQGSRPLALHLLACRGLLSMPEQCCRFPWDLKESHACGAIAPPACPQPRKVPAALPALPPADCHLHVRLCFAWSWGPVGWLASGARGRVNSYMMVKQCSRAPGGSRHTRPAAQRSPAPARPQVPSEIQTLETRLAGMAGAVSVSFLFW